MKLLALVSLGVLAAAAPAQITRSGAGYLLRVKYVKGSVLRFSSTNSVRGVTGQPTGEFKVALPVVMKVQDVQGPVALVRVTIGPAKSGGSSIYPEQSLLVRLDNRNKTKEGQTSVGTQLPEKPVKIGQTWTSKAPVSTGMTDMGQLTAVYRFAGVKSEKGQSVAVITYQLKGKARGSGRMLLSMADGLLVSNQLKISFNAGTAPITMSSVMQRG